MARHPDQVETRAGAACPLLHALPGRMTALATHTPLDASPGRFWRHMNANARVFIHVADAKLAVSSSVAPAFVQAGGVDGARVEHIVTPGLRPAGHSTSICIQCEATLRKYAGCRILFGRKSSWPGACTRR